MVSSALGCDFTNYGGDSWKTTCNDPDHFLLRVPHCALQNSCAHAALVWKSGSSPYGDILSSSNHAVQELFVRKGKCFHSAG